MSQTDTPRFNIHSGNELTWNVKPILHEIRHALLELLDNGNTSVIDLRSIPLAPGEEETIISALGQGEVHARLDALGRSDIVETTYSGVWLVTHYNENEAVVGRFIEITELPAILKSQREDMSDALIELTQELETTDT
ncbi:MAG: hydrogenase expression/formation protein [Xanthomonadales bacterium]|jgi:hydrogenase-1 operon protein HyaF|nr:hydrogenase expression/formation protein [Xanthomonadales bacterium]MDH4019292.1 hydrogenase expression/formation protein [Xanthomonadales bacterium]